MAERLTDNGRVVVYLLPEDARYLRELRTFYERREDRTLTQSETIRKAIRDIATHYGITLTDAQQSQPGELI